MMYTVTATEKHNEKCSIYETKSLLYLMNYHCCRDEINYYVIDYFNDVTGIDTIGDSAWDIQSKGEKDISAKKIGEYLVTLFKNYLSCLSDKFKEYILFVEGVSNSVRNDNRNNVVKLSGLTPESIEKIKVGLLKSTFEKSYMKTYIDKIGKDKIIDIIPDFLDKFILVIDNKSVVDYVKDVTELGIHVLPEDDKMKKIFDEIKGIQNNKKLTSSEGFEISDLKGFSPSKKFLLKNEIVLLVSSRILNISGNLEDINPCSFNDIVAKYDNDEDKKDFISDCRNDLYRLMFDRNNSKNYWLFFEEIWLTVKQNKTLSVDNIYELCDKAKIKNARIAFDSAKYFIAIVKDGLL